MEKQSTRKFLKLLIALVALFLLAASALMLASCKEHVHQYELDQDKSTNATCNQAGSQTFVCPECGNIYVNVVPATGQHTWEETKVYPASCESEGWTVFTCSVCGTQKQDNWTPKLTHKYDVAETHEATCTSDGYQIFECTFCGDRYTDSQYTAEHPKLGHDWIVNETAEKEEDRTDADGWKVVKAANCLEAGRLERECARCGEVESKKGADATGHKVLDGGKYVDYEKVCAVDKNLVDAEGNRVYAFECDNENCPVNVVVDSRGTEKHYIKAVDHKMELDTDPTNGYVAATCTEKGKDVFVCEVCGEKETKETAKLDHAYNTIRSDGKTEVVVCIKDDGIKTFAKYMDFMKATVGASTFYDNQATYEANYAAAYNKANEITIENSTAYKTGTLDISCVCTRCGAPVVADGHKYIVAKYAEGSFTELEKDEEGALVDYSKEVAVSDMNCRYVEICSACGDIKTEGTHRNVSTATCRQGGVCEDCGRQVTAQLKHAYITIGDMIGADGKYAQPAKATADGKIEGTDLKWKDAYDAYIKVSATETWMVPVAGSCDSAQTTVTVCAQCLIDAAKGTDVTWNQATAAPVGGIANAVSNTNAYVITTEFAHDYELTYFDLSATDPATDAQVQYKDTSCQVGFKTAYVCTKCGDVYINAPVGDDPETEKVNEAKDNKAEAYVGAPNAFTDAKGFILDTDLSGIKKVEGQDDVTFTNITVDQLAKVAADDHFGQHLIYLEEDYTKTNGYVAANCVETQKLAFVCLHCGTIVVLQPKQGGSLSDKDEDTGINDIQRTYEFAEYSEINAELGLSLTDLWHDATKINGDYDKNNHKNALLDCGAHCDAVNGTVKCSDKTDHTTITIDYKFQNEIIKYYKNYSLKVAVVSPDKNDKTLETDTFANHVTALLDGSKYAHCSGVDIKDGIKFTAPKAAAVSDWTKVEAGDTYLVLVDEDGTIYQLTASDVEYFTDDSTDGNKEAISGTTNVVSSDTYYVSFDANSSATTAPVTASDVDSLKLALANQPVDVKEGNVTEKVVTVDVVANIAFTGTDASTAGKEGFRKLVQDNVNANATRLVINLNGHKISEDYKWGFNLDGAKAKSLDEVVFNNGTVEYTKIESNVLGAFEIKAGQKYTFNAVTVISNASGIEVGDPVYTAASGDVAASWKVASLVMTDSTVKAKGTYGVYTEADKDNCNASTAYDTSIKAISLKNTNIIMNYGDKPLTANATQEGATALNTAFYFDAPVAAEIVGGTFSANGQVVVVRAGSVSIDGTALNLYTTTATENTGRWNTTGNDVSRAYITVGNNSDSVLQYTTSLFLDEVKFGGTDTTETVVYVASYFKADTITAFQKAQGLDSDETPIMVYVDAGDLVSGDTVDYVAGRVENTTQFVNAGDITGIR